MKPVTRAAWLFVFAASIFITAATSARGNDSARTIVILHTNDIHGHLTPWRGWDGELAGKTVGGFARLGAEIKQVRSAKGAEHVLLLDAGDTLGDTLIAHETRGSAVMAAMNALRYDAMVIGNHEPDFGSAALRARIGEARFPVLAANIENRYTGQLFARATVLREVGGVRIGILGIAYPNTPLTTAKRNVERLRFRDAIATARVYVPRLRAEGAQVVIALTHLGLGADEELARAIPDIDVIVGGHSHNRMREALRIGRTLIVQAGAHGSDLGRLDLTVEDGRITAHQRTLIALTRDAADPEIGELIARQIKLHAAKMNKTVGRAATTIARAQTLAGQDPRKRDAESPADDLFADVIREKTGADVALLPGVGYGVAIPPGEITADQLRNLVPHDATVWVMRLTGEQIKAVLEQAIENVFTNNSSDKVGGMIQVSGLRFRYDSQERRGSRVKEMTIGFQPLSPDRNYTVATNALLAQGGHNYRAFARGTNRRQAGKQYDLIQAWMGEQDKVTAPTTDRIMKHE
ncbi:MAG: bifunctional metallophosphatase/5'-nucleotidase [Betaproteobacteria bacterium]|nr:bifunctional metallophosphatase/5'-nucleotidase [Betaproteobacteria bacterium]